MDAFAQVRIVLRTERERDRDGSGFNSAWYRALRQILPPDGCVEELRAEHEATKAVLRETKPWWRAAYEHREPTAEEIAVVQGLADRRTADLHELIAA